MILQFVPAAALRIAPLVWLIALVGCSSQETLDPYYRAESLETMKVPEGVETTSLEPLYVIPEVPNEEDELLLGRGYGRYETPRPDPLPVTDETETGVKIQKLGDERWILIDAATSQVWPRTQAFLSRYGINAAVNRPDDGLIETDWIRFTDENDVKHRYRIWIEPGLRPETTEVHVVHRQVPESFGDPTKLEWNRESENQERESVLLDDLAGALAADARNSSASLLGQNVGGSAKADIEFVEAEPVLKLRLSYDRTWATVTHALNQDRFALWGNDPEKGVALAGYLLEDPADRSFLTRWLADELPEEAPASLDKVLSHLADKPAVRALFDDVAGTAFGEPLELDNSYLIVIETRDNQSYVFARAVDGSRLSPRVARQLLGSIRRNLI